MSATKPPPTVQRIAEDVIARIRAGKLKPGDRIREQELAERFNTSRGPVREALRVLDSKFWVTLEAGKGARVIHMDANVHPDATLIGQALNGVAAKLAAMRATPEEQEEFERQARAIAEAAQTDIAPEAFSEMTWRMGSMIVKAARSPRLDELIGAFARGGLVQLAHEGVQSRSQRMAAARLWIDVVAAIRLHDPKLAEQAMRDVIGRSLLATMRSAIEPTIWRAPGND